MFSPHLPILPESQRDLWPQLGTIPGDFVLYGGTAIALRLGHRVSVDFDFFSSLPLDRHRKDQLLDSPVLETGELLQDEKNTLVVSVRRLGQPVKVSFFGEVGNGRIGMPELTQDRVMRVAALDDLFARKLKVLHDRAEGKDYEDIAAILRSGVPLERGIGAALGLFGDRFSIASTVKALVYFYDVEESWRLTDAVKQELRQAVTQLAAPCQALPRASNNLD